MPRFALKIEYDGGPFAGWQAQADQPSVQGAIEAALARLDPGFAAGARVAAAGRTDAGVHATGQVAHIDLSKTWKADKVRDAINAHLRLNGEAVAIFAVQAVADDFDARFSAKARHYVYRILNRRAPPALQAGKVWWVPKKLDAAAMHEAAQPLLGKHDFTTFRSTECQAKSPEKTLDRLDVSRAGEEVHVNASARSFLHNQVRSMVGSLAFVGDGKWSADDLSAALAARDRSACAPVAPPEGLYLVRVDY